MFIPFVYNYLKVSYYTINVFKTVCLLCLFLKCSLFFIIISYLAFEIHPQNFVLYARYNFLELFFTDQDAITISWVAGMLHPLFLVWHSYIRSENAVKSKDSEFIS